MGWFRCRRIQKLYKWGMYSISLNAKSLTGCQRLVIISIPSKIWHVLSREPQPPKNPYHRPQTPLKPINWTPWPWKPQTPSLSHNNEKMRRKGKKHDSIEKKSMSKFILPFVHSKGTDLLNPSCTQCRISALTNLSTLYWVPICGTNKRFPIIN